MNTSIPVSAARGTGSAVRRNAVLATCCLSLFMVSMDATIVNVALPDIRRELQASVSGLQWVIDAYTIILASFLMLGGATADRFGRRRVFRIGMSLFAFGSLVCSLAPSIGWLIAARVLQAAGGSMMNPVAMSIIVHTFAEPKAKARAIGIWGAVAGASLALGPLAGGILTGALGWHAIFWINVPVCALALWMTARFVPESRAPHPRRPDPIGQALLLIGLGTLVFAVIESGRGAAVSGAAGIIAVSAFAGLVAYERGRHQPLLDVRFFRSPPFSAATVIALSMFASQGGFLFLSSLYLQEVRGLSAFDAGLCILPVAAAMMVISPLSGRLVGAFGTRPSLLVSGSMLSLSGLLLTRLQAGTPMGFLLTAFALFGVALGMVNAPITFSAVSGMPRAQAGLASAVATTSRQIGISVGVALAGALAGEAAGSREGAAWAGFPGATHPFWWLLVGAGIVIFALGWLTTGSWARERTARIAHLLEEPQGNRQ